MRRISRREGVVSDSGSGSTGRAVHNGAGDCDMDQDIRRSSAKKGTIPCYDTLHPIDIPYIPCSYAPPPSMAHPPSSSLQCSHDLVLYSVTNREGVCKLASGEDDGPCANLKFKVHK